MELFPDSAFRGKAPRSVISAAPSSQNPIWLWIIKAIGTLGEKQNKFSLLFEKTFFFQAYTHRWTLHLKEFPNVLWSEALMQKVAPVDLLLRSFCPPSGSLSWVQQRYLYIRKYTALSSPFKPHLTALSLFSFTTAWAPLRDPRLCPSVCFICCRAELQHAGALEVL